MCVGGGSLSMGLPARVDTFDWALVSVIAVDRISDFIP